jgi:signal peptidase II
LKQKYLILFSLSGLILALDQLSKLWFHTRMEEGFAREIIPGVFALTHRRSSGFAFGLVHSMPEPFHGVFLIGIPLFALILIILIFIKLRDGQMGTSLALTTIFSGAVGNLLDRIRYGYVVDFFLLKAGDFFTLPALNIADAAIVTGIVVMLVNTLRQQEMGSSNV